MKKVLKRLLIILSIVFALLIILVTAVLSLFEDQVGQRVITEVNKQLTTELRVDGFDLSFLTTFPNIGANLQGVELDDPNGGILLEADEVSFRAGIFSLLGSKLNVKSVVISDGALNVQIDRNGKANYDITPESEASADSGSSTAINLQNATLKDIELIYQDAQEAQQIRLQVEEANFSGQFSSERFRLKSDADTRVGLIELDGERYLAGQPLLYSAEIDVNSATGLYQLSGVEVTVGELPLAAAGTIQMSEGDAEYDLTLSSNDGNLAAVLQLIPGKYREAMADIETRGDFQFLTTVKGQATATKNPLIESTLRFNNGRVSGDRIDGSIKDVSFVATYTNGERQDDVTSVFEVRELTGYFQRELFEIRLKVDNFDNPTIDFLANGAMGMGVLAGFIPDERVTDGVGRIEIDGLQLQGRYEDMIRTSRINRVNLGGRLLFHDAGVNIKGERVRLESGQVALEDNLLSVTDLKLTAPGTDMSFSGTAYNLIPVLFADSVNSKRAELEFNAELQAESIDIDQLIALGEPTEEVVEAAEVAGQADSLAQAEVEERAFRTQFLNGTFQANIQEFNYGEIEGREFTGTFTFDNNDLKVEGQTQAMGGEFILEGNMAFTNEPELKARLTCNRVDINEFFRQAENFGQDVLVADNLDGALDARILILAYWDEAGNFDEDKLRVLAGIGLHEGELKDFEMLNSFSTYVNIRDLRQIRFTNLENFLEIRNRRLYIPAMFIQSNALNLTISGEHSFDHEVAYYFKVNAGQVLANRFKQHDSNLDPKPARRTGFFNLYYAMLGTIDDYNISSQKRRVKSDFERSELRKRDIRDELEREFRTVIELVEEPVDWRDIPEYEQDWGDDDEPEFLDEIEGTNGGG